MGLYSWIKDTGTQTLDFWQQDNAFAEAVGVIKWSATEDGQKLIGEDIEKTYEEAKETISDTIDETVNEAKYTLYKVAGVVLVWFFAINYMKGYALKKGGN